LFGNKILEGDGGFSSHSIDHDDVLIKVPFDVEPY
jgi:hypothetical protein